MFIWLSGLSIISGNKPGHRQRLLISETKERNVSEMNNDLLLDQKISIWLIWNRLILLYVFEKCANFIDRYRKWLCDSDREWFLLNCCQCLSCYALHLSWLVCIYLHMSKQWQQIMTIISWRQRLKADSWNIQTRCVISELAAKESEKKRNKKREKSLVSC